MGRAPSPPVPAASGIQTMSPGGSTFGGSERHSHQPVIHLSVAFHDEFKTAVLAAKDR